MAIVIIGAGPAGYVCALELANKGVEVILIDSGQLGGVCLNEGCIPTKSLLHNSKFIGDSGSWLEIQAEKERVISTLKAGVETLLFHENIKILKGKARFYSASKIEVNGACFDFDKAIIATGSSPVIPEFAKNVRNCIDSTVALSMDKLPKSLCIIGGGVVGCELAALFNNLGVKVTIIEAAEDILLGFEKKHVAFIKRQMKLVGIDIHTSCMVSSVRDSGFSTTVVYNDNGVESRCSCDKVIVSIGRKANIESLNLDECGVRLEANRIHVDENFKTSADNIYAIGDCASNIKLAYWASTQAKKLAQHLTQGVTASMPSEFPSCVFTNPEIAKVGKTESELAGINIKSAELPFSSNGKAHCINAAEGYVKIIIDADSKRILGGHIVGPMATELISILTPLVMNNCAIDILASSMFAHPTLSEIIADVADQLIS